MSFGRTEAIEVMKSAIGASFVEQMGWGESKPMAALEAYAVANGQAEQALDALLGYLTEHAGEWEDSVTAFGAAVQVRGVLTRKLLAVLSVEQEET